MDSYGVEWFMCVIKILLFLINFKNNSFIFQKLSDLYFFKIKNTYLNDSKK